MGTSKCEGSGQREGSQHLVKAQPMRRSSSCRASTESASLWSGSPRRAMALQMSVSVMELNLARNTVFSPPPGRIHGGQHGIQDLGEVAGCGPIQLPRSPPPALHPTCGPIPLQD